MRLGFFIECVFRRLCYAIALRIQVGDCLGQGVLRGLLAGGASRKGRAVCAAGRKSAPPVLGP